MPQHGWTRVEEPPASTGWTPVHETPEESGVPTATAADMLTRRGISSDTSDSPETFSGLHQMLRGVAQPESVSDMLPLLIPNAMGAVGNAARTYFRTAKEALSEGSTARQLPGRMLGKLYGKAFPTAEPVSNATGSVRWDPPPDPPRPTPPHLDLSRQIKAGSMTPEQMAERSAKVKAEGYTPPPRVEKGQIVHRDLYGKTDAPPPITGRLQMAPPPEAPLPPTAAPPMQVDTASLPESWKALAEPPPAAVAPPPSSLGNPLDPSRVNIGAEQTGRAVGLSKQAVRDVATPVLGEAQGAASPILPQGALTRIIDTIKALPPGGPEREAFVARATSGKTQWQVENIRRTLEHLGLIVPVAATGAGALRETIRQRLTGNPEG